MRYLKTIFIDVKFLHDMFRYPFCLLRYILQKKNSNSKLNSVELGQNWRKSFVDFNSTDWRTGREESLIKNDNENYIRYLLKKNSKQYHTILDIGSYAGYFFDDYSCFNKIICADMFDESRKFIENKFKKEFDFVLLNGHDFSNIESDSIDFVFSIHSLERVPRNVLIKYFNDINRITSKNSFVFMQVPDCFYYNSLDHNFTFISACKLQNLLSSFETTIDYTISTISPIIIGEKNEI